LIGKIKFYNIQKKWGFIIGEDNFDYFFHYSQIKKGTILNKDDEVEFIPVKSERGYQALKVVKL
jgi:CspA family cold shock protein